VEQSETFEQERSQVAPEQSPDGDTWVPADAPSQSLQWSVQSVAKAGSIGVIGVYPLQMTSFRTGEAMNKNLSVKMGNCNLAPSPAGGPDAKDRGTSPFSSMWSARTG
jgi:threonine dehydrogenase-like Zn-dependent dehydrogenase